MGRVGIDNQQQLILKSNYQKRLSRAEALEWEYGRKEEKQKYKILLGLYPESFQPIFSQFICQLINN
jgi:hypothetical protein